ncbi:putative reverse transcriptase domain-containing protein, partial [Tanacetum coccineum]
DDQQDDNVEANGDNGNNNDNGNGNGNPNVNNRGVVSVAQECTYQDLVKCQLLNFKGTKGVVGLTCWFEKIKTVFHISNFPPRNQVKYASCTLLDGALTWWNSYKRTAGVDAAYAMMWNALMKLMTEVYCPRNEIQKMETELWNLTVKEEDKVEKYIGGLPDSIQRNVITAEPVRLQDAIYIANKLMEQKLKGYAIKNVENKRRPIRLETMLKGERMLEFCLTETRLLPPLRGPQLEIRREILAIRNKTGNNEAKARAYAIGGGGDNSDSNVVTSTFLLNNCYTSMLFDSGSDRSFVSTTFSGLLDVIPSTLDTSYAIDLADGRISKTNVILRGYTLGLLGHPFDIDRMPVELGSFDVIVGMDWLAKYLLGSETG